VSKQELGGPGDVQNEIERFEKAVDLTRRELETLSDKVADLVEGRQLIEVHMLILDDPTIQRDVRDRIINDLVNAEYAVSQVLSEVVERFRNIEDSYMKERVADVRDVGRRLMSHLMGTEREVLRSIDHQVVLVSKDLDPSDTANLPPDMVVGFATDKGGKTSHTAIVARSLGIPAVVGLRDLAEKIQPGQTLIVDGIHARVIVEPDPDEILYYSELRKKYLDTEQTIALNAEESAVTTDGFEIELSANIEFSQEAEQVRRYGGYGVGLFRTEFLKLLSPAENDEETQFQAYKHVLQVLDPDPVIIRTFDLGGDKFPGALDGEEANPFLGWRAVRIGLDRPEIMRTQLRAILRASVFGKARLLLPMVTDVGQIRAVKEHLSAVMQSLHEAGEDYDGSIDVGIMVETPAASMGIDLMLPEVDFVSIGTNDLTQYTLAVDRGSPYVAKLYDPYHPVVLRQVAHVVRECVRENTWVGICGQMASEPLAIPFLIGLELDELSVVLPKIPDIKSMVRAISLEQSKSLVEETLKVGSSQEVMELFRSFVKGKYPEVLLD
jgi:phosphotransferase system enzyme I (PtsI)